MFGRFGGCSHIVRLNHLCVMDHSCQTCKVPDWVEEQRWRKWQFAGHSARREDGRWTQTILNFDPKGKRNQGHPAKRWSDDIEHFLKHMFDKGGLENRFKIQWKGWQDIAVHRDAWKLLAHDFKTYGNCKLPEVTRSESA